MGLIAWIKGFLQKAWVKALLALAAKKLKEILIKVGEDAMTKIKTKIIEVGQSSMTGPEKAKAVAKYIKELVPGLADSAINYLIESLVQQLKDQKAI